MRLRLLQLDSPLGPLELVLSGTRLCALAFPGRRRDPSRDLERRFGPIELDLQGPPVDAERAVRAYFAGEFRAVEALDVDPGGTPFQREVWTALRRIPPGRTVSYGALAQSIGRPRSARAVARANATNPVPIVIPCHRVIGSDGSLTGYGGGLDNKRWLLRHESAEARLRFG